jgi:autotransporter translocation and assembly factor TamB
VCPLCGALQTEHWADGAGGRRARILRAGLLEQVVRRFGLTLSDWGGTAYVLSDRKGRAEVVHDLSTLWTQAELLAGRPLDPLDPVLLAGLSRDG